MTRVLALTCLWLAACADRPFDNSSNTIDSTCTSLGNLSDADYFARFQYRFPSDDASLNQLNDGDAAHAMMSAMAPLTLPGNRQTTLWVNMFPDGGYRAAYNELACDGTGICGTDDPNVIVGGSWSFDQGAVTFEGLGRGTRAIFESTNTPVTCTSTIELTYAHDLKTAGIAGRAETMAPQDFATSDEGLF